ncbi:MAG: 2-oxo acid dehydrogenase subunit E2 [Rhodopirellula sp.]|nr:2-oxo acid dehydrogenase subunit E2 [Rhodopirellula sp.]
MTTEFKLPELGENIESGDVVNVLVREGERIEGNQGVVELETDKAVVEIPCPHAGTVAKIQVKKGDTVKVGQTILTIEADGEGQGAVAETTSPAPKEAAAAKAEPAPPEEETELPIRSQRPEATPISSQSTEPDSGEVIPAGPAARRIAREMGVDLQQVQGSGSRGRITPEDVRAAASGPAKTPQAARIAEEAAEPLASMEPVVPPGEPGQDAWGMVRRDRMSRVRKTIAAQMVRSATTAVHLTNFDDADITDLEQLRKGVPKGWLGANVRLTTMPFVLKAVAIALRRHPLLNASLDEENEQIVYKQYVHLGVAVDTPRGLVVPVVRDVDRMTIPEIARAIASVAQRARAVQFAVEELRGGTFSISNLGAVGGTYSTPIINHPEVAILLLGRSRWLPVVRDEGARIEPRLMLPLSLSYDHRLVDGATAARFLNDVIDYLQTPGKLLLAE